MSTPQLDPTHPAGERTFAVGDRVYLRGARFGLPGVVLRLERRKLAVLWADLGPTYIGRHNPASLTLADRGDQ